MTSTDLTTRSTEEQLIAAAKADLGITDVADLIVPRLKIAQSLTKEVVEGEARPGELIHSLTGESYGNSVDLIVVQAFKGRQWKDKDRNLHNAGLGETEVPWEDHPCYGQPFVDCPDAEETYRAQVNANQKDWGSGPGIATTYNFVGLIVREDGEMENFPVRLSLVRSGAKEGRNWFTMLNISRSFWDSVYSVTTKDARSRSGDPFIAVSVKQERRTTDEEKAQALQVAELVLGGSVDYEAGADDTEARPTEKPKGTGLDL